MMKNIGMQHPSNFSVSIESQQRSIDLDIIEEWLSLLDDRLEQLIEYYLILRDLYEQEKRFIRHDKHQSGVRSSELLLEYFLTLKDNVFHRIRCSLPEHGTTDDTWCVIVAYERRRNREFIQSLSDKINW